MTRLLDYLAYSRLSVVAAVITLVLWLAFIGLAIAEAMK